MKINIDIPKVTAKAELFLRTNGPTIAFGAGVALLLTGTGLAVHKAIIRKYGECEDCTIAEMHESFEWDRGNQEYHKQQVPEDEDVANKAIRKSYIDEVKFFAKTFWLPATLIVTGTGLLVGSYAWTGARLAAMTAAYNKVLAANTALMTKVSTVPNDEEVIDIPDGPCTTNPYYDIDPSAITGMPYSYWFAPTCYDGKPNPRWSNSMNSNFSVIDCSFERLNTQLQTKGYVYLNEVLERFRIALAPEGYQVGYIYSLTENVQNQIDYYATAYLIENGQAKRFNGDEIPEGADVRIALSVVPDGSIDKCVYSRLFKTA